MGKDYNETAFTKIRVCGIECDFSGMRIDRSTVPKERYQYETADDGSDGVFCLMTEILNTFGIRISEFCIV